MGSRRPLGIATLVTVALLASATPAPAQPTPDPDSTSAAGSAARSVATSAQHRAPLDREFGEPEDLGPLIRSVSLFDSAYGTEAGHDVLYTTVTGTPASFQVVDLDTNELLRAIPLPGAADSWSHAVDADGTVYISGGGRIFRYRPGQSTVTDLGRAPEASVLYGLAPDGAGNVYAGTYPDGRVVRYDGATGQYVDLGSVVEGQDYVRGLAYHDGTIYAGVGTVGSLWAIDPATGTRAEIALPQRPEYDPAKPPMIYSLNAVGDLLFAYLSETNLLLVYDLSTGRWLDTAVTGYRGLYTSPEWDGKVYLVAGGRLRSFDLTSHELVDTGLAFGTYLRHAAWVDVSATNPELPGLSLVTAQFGGSVSFMNLQSGRVLTKPTVLQGSPIPLQTLERGPDGLLYASGYPGGVGARFDPAGNTLTPFPLGQSEGMAALGDTLYFGNYPGAVIHALDTTRPIGTGNPRQAHDIGEGQDRPFAMTSGDGRLFVGTIATYGQRGGAVTIMDGDTWTTYRDLVPDQSVMSLAYRDGKLYGSTTVWGGLGIEPSQSQARIFVFDVATRALVTSVVPDLPGAVTPKAIGSLTFGPDGLLWGAAWGTIFALDPGTLRVVKSREIVSTDWSFGHLWRPIQLRFAPDGLLYTTLGSDLVVVDPATLDHRVLAEDTALMTLGADGHVYYGDGAALWRIRDLTPPARPTIIQPDHPIATTERRPSIVVRVESGARVRILDGERVVGRATAGTDGSVAVPVGPLQRGRHRLAATATDAAGNTSRAAEVPLIIVR